MNKTDRWTAVAITTHLLIKVWAESANIQLINKILNF